MLTYLLKNNSCKKMQTNKCLSRFPVTDYCTFPRCQDLLNREWCFMLRHVAVSMFFPLQRPNYIPETEHDGNRKKETSPSSKCLRVGSILIQIPKKQTRKTWVNTSKNPSTFYDFYGFLWVHGPSQAPCIFFFRPVAVPSGTEMR